MSRASQNRQAETRGKKASGPRPAEGNGQSAAAEDAVAPSATPAAFDAAIDTFVSRAQQEFVGASVTSNSIGKGTYHSAPANLPWRFLALGLTLGLAAGLISSLALR